MSSVKTPAEALKNLADPEWAASLPYRRQAARIDWTGANPDIKEFAVKLVKHARKYDVPLYVHCCLRSNEVQADLKARGVSKAGPGQSPHNYGLAVDIVHGRRHWELNGAEWDLIGTMGFEVARKMNLKVEWGGNWNFWDPAHWQLEGWKALKP